MLPFLKNKLETSAVGPGETLTRDHDDDFDFLQEACSDVIHAIETKDKHLLAQALRAAISICKDEHEGEDHAS